MSGIANSTGARSGVLGTTVGSVDLATATFPAGHILQTVTANKVDVWSADIAEYAVTAVTGLSVAITPATTSNHVLIMYNIYMSCEGGGDSQPLTSLYHNGSEATWARGTPAGSDPGRSTYASGLANNYGMQNMSFCIKHTPGSISEQTYAVYVGQRSESNNDRWVYVNRLVATGGTDGKRVCSNITVQEIQA